MIGGLKYLLCMTIIVLYRSIKLRYTIFKIMSFIDGMSNINAFVELSKIKSKDFTYAFFPSFYWFLW